MRELIDDLFIGLVMIGAWLWGFRNGLNEGLRQPKRPG